MNFSEHSDELNVALIQTRLTWEIPSQNRTHIENLIAGIQTHADLIILPEMFSTGFTMTPEHTNETMDGATVAWMKQLAYSTKSALCGSVAMKEDQYFVNRFLFVTPDGGVQHYDKRHTFTFAGEDKVYKAGDQKVIIAYKGWKICPQICYDLRFPVWSRNTESYDLLIYVANWPKTRIDAWDTLLKARAIENMSYCIGVNRIGQDANNLEYTGHSGVYNVLGHQICFNSKEEKILQARLQKREIFTYRDKLKFLQDGDQFTLM